MLAKVILARPGDRRHRGFRSAARGRHGARLPRGALAAGRSRPAGRVGTRGASLRRSDDVVSAPAPTSSRPTRSCPCRRSLFLGGGSGFFALPYTIIVFPLMFLVMPRLWSACHRHGYVTTGDLVRGRYGSRSLALVVALLVSWLTMPYIAVQLEGLKFVLDAMGVPGPTELSLVLAFAILAAYTYHSGLRAPALIGIVEGRRDLRDGARGHDPRRERNSPALGRSSTPPEASWKARRRRSPASRPELVPRHRVCPPGLRDARARVRRLRCCSTRTSSPPC